MVWPPGSADAEETRVMNCDAHVVDVSWRWLRVFCDDSQIEITRHTKNRGQRAQPCVRPVERHKSRPPAGGSWP